MSTQQVTTDRTEGILLIGLNRPSKYNAVNLTMLKQLSAAYGALGNDPEIRVGVLYGHGDHFCAGLDLAEMWPTLLKAGPAILAGEGPYDPLRMWGDPVPKPVVIAVHGIAYTLAIELALAADIVVAAEDVRFRQLEVGRGILPFGGATFRAPAHAGWGNAMHFLLTAEEFGAVEAHRIGLVQKVAPVGKHLDEAISVARRIAAQAPEGVQQTLANARIAFAEQERSAVEHLRGIVPRILASADAKEGLQSFIERRRARF